MRYRNYGPKGIKAGGFKTTEGPGFFSDAGFPKSGTSGTLVDTFGEGVPPYSLYVDSNTGVVFVNEGSLASPYWTPLAFKQRGLLAWHTDFTDGAGPEQTAVVTLGLPVADTAAAQVLTNGIRIHGQGIEVADSGLTIAMSDQGAIATLTATDEDAHTAVISVGNGTTPVFQPDQNGTCVVDAMVAINSLTASAAFLGFCGSAANALDPIMTYSGTTISFAATIGDDVAGLAFSSELTDADRWFAPHDKGNTNASISTAATGVDTGVDLAAGVYQRLRVECDADGVVRVFIDKALISTFSACLDADEEIQPMFYIESSTTATKAAFLKHFSAWGKRPA